MEPERTEPAGAALSGWRVWVDAQLPPVLARWLARDYGVDAEHVNEIGLLGEGRRSPRSSPPASRLWK